MNYVKLFWNNGSVPDPYFYQFNLELFTDGNANLNISSGRDPELEIIENGSKKVPPQSIVEMLELLNHLSPTKKTGIMVGGPEQFIEIKHKQETKVLFVSEDNPMVYDYFIKCLQLYSSDLQKRLESIF